MLSNCSTPKLVDINALETDMENTRFQKYLNAKSAEEAYPPEDRPRGKEDIVSVNYHIKTQKAVSPIIVMQIEKNGKIRSIKLDGVHRIIAAIIRKSKVKVFYINPRKCSRNVN